VELYNQHAPKTCKNFATLAQRGYYNGVVFHRVIRDFMIQGGDPTGTGRGGTSIYGEKFEDEIHPALKRRFQSQSHWHLSTGLYFLRGFERRRALISLCGIDTGAGILSMANAGPNSNGSQFFITLAPTPWLDGKHTIFGRVKSGMGIVQRMGLVPTGTDDKPQTEVKIVKAKVLGDEE